MKKIFSMIVVMLLGATSMMAQIDTKQIQFGVEGGLGTELELGARAEYNLMEYLSWDVAHVKYAFDYGKNSFSELTLTTGLRGYTPSFGPDLKAFAAVDMGYGLAFNGDFSSSNFAVDFTIGLKFGNMYAGYGLGCLTNNGNHLDHVLRVGYNF